MAFTHYIPFLLTIVLYAITNPDTFAQAFKEGTLTFGVQEVNFAPSDTSSLQTRGKIKEDIMNILDMQLILSDNRVAQVTNGRFGSQERIFYDLDSGLAYRFLSIYGRERMKVDSFNTDELNDRNSQEAEDLFKGGTTVPSAFDGMEAIRYELPADSLIESITLTDYYHLPPYIHILPITVPKNRGFLKCTVRVSPTITIELGLIKLSTEIDDLSVFSIDSIAVDPNSNTLFSQTEESTSTLASIDSSAWSFNQLIAYRASQDRLQAGRKIVQDLTSSGTWMNLKVIKADDESMITSFDHPSIILRMIYELPNARSLSFDSIQNVLQRHNLITPTVQWLLNSLSFRREHLESRNKWEVLYLAAMNDHLKDSDTRKIIAGNLEFKDSEFAVDSSIREQYINGEIDLNSVLESLTIFYTYRSRQFVRSIDICPLSKKVLLELHELPEFRLVTCVNDTLKVSAVRNNYFLDTKVAMSQDFDDPAYNSTGVGRILDTSLFDRAYELVIDFANQISADEGLNMRYGLHSLHSSAMLEIREDDYIAIVEQFPQLDLGLDHKFWTSLKQPLTYNDRNVSTSYIRLKDDESDYYYDQKLYNVLPDPFYYSLPIISFQDKLKVLTFIDSFSNDLKLTAVQYRFYRDKFLTTNFESTLDALRQLHPAIVEVRDESGQADEFTLQSGFIPPKNSFSNAFPTLDWAFGRDFMLTDFKYHRDSNRMSFTLDNEEHTIPFGKNSMFMWLQERLEEHPNGKGLYSHDIKERFRTQLFYITPSQVEYAKSVLGIELQAYK